ncbi:AAA family ATPase [candidate division KSB1 bacterium]|nr:AAA family ATPase [candidate division KSB1 bacterium]
MPNYNMEVPLEKLRWRCPAESLDFQTTDEIAAITNFIGQERAQKAIALGLQMKAPGYNIFVAGPNGTGKATIVKSILAELKGKGPIPPDLVFVHNFEYPGEPKLIRLPAGQGKDFANEMDVFIAELQNILATNAAPPLKPQDEGKRAAKKSSRDSATAWAQNRISELKNKYPDRHLAAHWDRVQAFLVTALEQWQAHDIKGMPFFVECRANLVVDNSHSSGAPVIFEPAPTYNNLFGTMARVQDRDGLWRTDFTQIKAGALARANGGYLLFNLPDAVSEPGVWRTLKRALRDRRLEIHAHEPVTAAGAAPLRPEAIALDVKVVVLADLDEYYHLYRHDDDFFEIFKMRADFDTSIPNEASAHRQYAGFIKKICQAEALLPFERSAVAAVIEHGVRLAGLQTKISTRFGEITDLLREADFWARGEKNPAVTARHVRRALDEKNYLLRLSEERLFERIRAGRLMIDVEGQKAGQVNALMILNYLDYVFGYPSRITAAVGMGSSGIINIEREADLSGKTHNKGVAIISGYMRSKYAHDKPLSMSASIAFEQSTYSVDGDSASVAEVCAILSALSGSPLRQDLAITGSINQKGEIQSIGAVNEKIEGFFNACQAKGLTGTQGVIIPRLNLDDLMLPEAVIEVVAQGNFHLYAVTCIDEGLELLTGVPAGEKDAESKYPEGTLHYKVDQRLRELSKEKKDNRAEEKKEEKPEAEKKESAKPAQR